MPQLHVISLSVCLMIVHVPMAVFIAVFMFWPLFKSPCVKTYTSARHAGDFHAISLIFPPLSSMYTGFFFLLGFLLEIALDSGVVRLLAIADM